VRLGIFIQRGEQDLPLSFTSSGIREAPYLNTVIAGDGEVICLDEPALNLYLATQSTFVYVLDRASRRSTGAQEDS
jgi:ABC-type enterochelin transport system ATPase subunit